MAAAIESTLTTLPFTQLRKNRFFYFYYDGFYALICVAALALMLSSGHRGLFGEGGLLGAWSYTYLLALPLVCYAQILCSVFVHVCTHGSFPKPYNRIIGELCGVVILTRFASWEVLHQKHHRNSDSLDKDPHPVGPSYWAFCWHHVANLEKHLHEAVFEVHGDTPENRRLESIRSVVSFATGALLITTWFVALGWIAFLAFFLPASIIGFFHLVHFNWSTHDAKSPSQNYRPVNLNHGLFSLGNKLFFGIYMHANHHRWANVLNPAKVKNSLPIEPAPTREDLAAWRKLKREYWKTRFARA